MVWMHFWLRMSHTLTGCVRTCVTTPTVVSASQSQRWYGGCKLRHRAPHAVAHSPTLSTPRLMSWLSWSFTMTLRMAHVCPAKLATARSEYGLHKMMLRSSPQDASTLLWPHHAKLYTGLVWLLKRRRSVPRSRSMTRQVVSKLAVTTEFKSGTICTRGVWHTACGV